MTLLTTSILAPSLEIIQARVVEEESKLFDILGGLAVSAFSWF